MQIGRNSKGLLNLIGNAIKYTPEGGEISVSASVHNGDQERVVFSVEDTGVEFQQTNWKEFRQVSPCRRKSAMSVDGTGLGLAITKLW